MEQAFLEASAHVGREDELMDAYSNVIDRPDLHDAEIIAHHRVLRDAMTERWQSAQVAWWHIANRFSMAELVRLWEAAAEKYYYERAITVRLCNANIITRRILTPMLRRGAIDELAQFDIEEGIRDIDERPLNASNRLHLSQSFDVTRALLVECATAVANVRRHKQERALAFVCSPQASGLKPDLVRSIVEQTLQSPMTTHVWQEYAEDFETV